MNKKSAELGLTILHEIAQQEMRLHSYLEDTQGRKDRRDERLVAQAKLQLCYHLSEFIEDAIAGRKA